MLDTTYNTISVDDVIIALKKHETDGNYQFASDLTGISVDKLWELVEERDLRYEIRGYYGTDISGQPLALAESAQAEDWYETEDKAHEMITKGFVTEIRDRKSGNSKVFHPDSYLAEFNGEFPCKAQDLA